MVDFNLDPTLMVRLTQESPIDAFARGVQTIQGIGQNQMSMKRQRMEMQQMQGQQQALKQFAQNPTDVKPLMPYMTPAQAVQAPYAISEQKMKMGEAILNKWNAERGMATLKTYPQMRQGFVKYFPDIANMFPPPDTFKTEEDLQKWIYKGDVEAYKLKNQMNEYEKAQIEQKTRHEDTYAASAGSQAAHRQVTEGQKNLEIGLKARGQQFKEGKGEKQLTKAQLEASYIQQYNDYKATLMKLPDGPEKVAKLQKLDELHVQDMKDFQKPGKGAKEVTPERLNPNLQLDKDAAGGQ